MATSAVRRRRALAPSGADVTLALLAGLLLVPPVIALRAVIWTAPLTGWTLPVAAAVGACSGLVLVAISAPRRWWWILACTLPLLGAGIAAGVLVTVGGAARGATPSAGTLLLGAYAAALGVAIPWLVLRAEQTWLAIVLAWLTVAAAWGVKLAPWQVWWIISLLALSVVLAGVAHLRAEMTLWRRYQIERLGPVLWPSARTILLLGMLVALVGLIPLGAARVDALSRAWRNSPAGQQGLLPYETANGTPVAVLGAPLGVNSPDVGGEQIVATYTIKSGPAVAPPLLGATLDAFDGTTWQRGPLAATVPATALKAPEGAQQMQATLTLVAPPRTGGSDAPLLGFGQPLAFSVPARAGLLAAGGGATPDAVTIAGWTAPGGLKAGASYDVTSAILPDDPPATGDLPTGLTARMTDVPAALRERLHAQATEWTAAAAPDATNAAKARALLDALLDHATLDPRAAPPANADALTWFLDGKRGNELLLTTAYILLGRSLGLPLRLAEGYLPGQYDTARRASVIRAKDATVWAQLAVPGAGWLDLFPGANVVKVQSPTIVYSDSVTPTPTEGAKATPTPPSKANQQQVQRQSGNDVPLGSAWLFVAVLVLAALLLGGAVLLALLSRWSDLGRAATGEAGGSVGLVSLGLLFARVKTLARLAGIVLRPSDTSAQATAKVAVAVPEHAAALGTLNGAYERLRYGPPGSGAPRLAEDLRAFWRRLSRTFYRLILTRRWRRTGPRSATVPPKTSR